MAVGAAPAKAVPVLAVEKEAVAAVEGRAKAMQAAGQALLARYRGATGRTRRRQASRVLLLPCRAIDARKFLGVYLATVLAHASRTGAARVKAT